jgi:hypothetical protein
MKQREWVRTIGGQFVLMQPPSHLQLSGECRIPSRQGIFWNPPMPNDSIGKHPRLTKKCLRVLELQLSIDDILYEKFRRLNEEVRNEWHKLYRAKQIVRVLRRTKMKGVMEEMQIQEVQPSPEGTVVVVR